METASPCGWPNNFSCHLPVFAADLVDNEDSPAFAADFSDDGKLGYGFTSADDLEEVDISPGDKPRPTFISKKLDPVLREEMIALLKEYRDCLHGTTLKCPVWIQASSSIGSRSRRDFGHFSNQHVR